MRRQILNRSLLTVAAASSILAVTGGYANADSNADSVANDSPGVLSGNSVSVPVHVPVNACGDSVDVVGLLNPAFGSSCSNGAPAPTPQQAQPPAPQASTPQPPAETRDVHTQLAETGTPAGLVAAGTGAGAALLLGGALLYRRNTRAARIRRTYS
jgi:hypothetical protein